MRRPFSWLPEALSTRTSGVPAKPGWDRPLITSVSLTVGIAALVIAIVCRPGPGRLNRTESPPGWALASTIARRRVPRPASAVLVTEYDDAEATEGSKPPVRIATPASTPLVNNRLLAITGS